MFDTLTCGLAYAAYLLLGCGRVAHACQRLPRTLNALLTVVLSAHVGRLWLHRFGESIETALECCWEPSPS